MYLAYIKLIIMLSISVLYRYTLTTLQVERLENIVVLLTRTKPLFLLYSLCV